MKLKKLKTKTVCFLLAIALIFQSCGVYKKTSVTLDEAVAADRKILVVKTDNTKLMSFVLSVFTTKIFLSAATASSNVTDVFL